VTGAGTCADRYAIDMSAMSSGAEVYHTTTGGGTDFTGSSTCAATTRETVYSINPKSGWANIQVSVDAASGDDTKISFFYSDFNCTGQEVSCTDAGGANTCEVASATYVSLATNYITFMVSSTAAGSSLTTRIRID
jgi:hypothetical protein